MRRFALTTIAVLVAACSDAQTAPASPVTAPPTPARPVTTPSAPAPPIASSREILVDLHAWDAATSASRRAAADDVARRLPDFALSRMETFSCGGQTHEVAIYAHAKTGMEFVLVPVGTFVMGAPKGDADELGSDESWTRPHRVALTSPFLLSRTECTEAAWDRVGGTDERKWHDPKVPIENVTWRACVDWCRKAGLELPTEAQWEYGCRAGTTTRWCTGDDERLLASVAWYAPDFDYPMQQVAGKAPNALGLFDVHGNTWELCRDTFGPYPRDAVVDPLADAPDHPTYGPVERVTRGGIAYNAGPQGDAVLAAPSAWRGQAGPDDHGDQTGFRPAKTVPME